MLRLSKTNIHLLVLLEVIFSQDFFELILLFGAKFLLGRAAIGCAHPLRLGTELAVFLGLCFQAFLELGLLRIGQLQLCGYPVYPLIDVQWCLLRSGSAHHRPAEFRRGIGLVLILAEDFFHLRILIFHQLTHPLLTGLTGLKLGHRISLLVKKCFHFILLILAQFQRVSHHLGTLFRVHHTGSPHLLSRCHSHLPRSRHLVRSTPGRAIRLLGLDVLSEKRTTGDDRYD